MNLITQITIYPADLNDFRLDARSPFGKPFMMVCFDYIREPEKDERIIRKCEDRFNDVDFNDMKIKPVSVREILTTRQTITTIFKPKISLS
jgi:hypothetical protein